MDNEFDLIIIGGGAGAFASAIKANELGAKTLMVNKGLPLTPSAARFLSQSKKAVPTPKAESNKSRLGFSEFQQFLKLNFWPSLTWLLRQT